jgi:hypothetical protein
MTIGRWTLTDLGKLISPLRQRTDGLRIRSLAFSSML